MATHVIAEAPDTMAVHPMVVATCATVQSATVAVRVQTVLRPAVAATESRRAATLLPHAAIIIAIAMLLRVAIITATILLRVATTTARRPLRLPAATAGAAIVVAAVVPAVAVTAAVAPIRAVAADK